MADLTQALTLLRRNSQKKATDASPTLSTSPPRCDTSEKDKTLPISSQSLHSQSQDYEDYDEIFKNCDVFEFSPINVNDSESPPPTHSKTRSVSQTDWSISSEPSHKRPLIQNPFHLETTRSVMTAVSSSVTTLATPTLSRLGISKQNVTPTCVIRKFPGPAGCLPPLDSIERLNNTPAVSVSSGGIPVTTPRRFQRNACVIYEHPDYQFDQLNGPWTRMLSELDLKDPLTSAVLNINIASIIRKASKKELPDGKVSHLCVLVQSVTKSTFSATAHLQDPTGEIHAAVHNSVVKEYEDEFVDGCAAILRQMSVLSPSSRKHYLNITLDNIIRVYPPEQQTSSTSRSCIRLSKIEEDYRQKENESYSSLLPSFGIKTTSDCSKGSSNSSDCGSVYTSNSIVTETTNTCSAVLNQSQTASDIEDDFDAYFEGIDVSILDF